MRAMLSPCSPSGKAQPITTSSIWAGSRFGVRLSKACITVAAISSGRTVASPPLFALPTGVRAADTITASFINISFASALVSKRFSRLQDRPHTRLCLLFTEERQNSFAFKVENILLAHPLWAGEFAAAHYIGQLARDVMIVLCDVLAFLEHPRPDA